MQRPAARPRRYRDPPRQGAQRGRPASQWAVYAVVANGVFMATLDSSAVNVCLPDLAEHFGVPLGPAIEWVLIAYLLVIAALLLTFGRLSDKLGHRRLWAAGLATFTLCSALAGGASSLSMLVAARALQGVGGACLMAISPAMLVAAFPPEQRGRAIGLNSVVVGLGISLGPVLGGLISEHLSWRWLFFLNLPLGISGLICTALLLPRDTSRPARFDPLGAATFGIGLAALMAGATFGNELGWSSWGTASALAVAALALAGFFLHERRHPDPIIDLGLFRSRPFSSACASLVLNFVGSFSLTLLLPFYLTQLRGLQTGTVGLLLLPMPLTLAVVSPLSGALADRIGSRWLTTLGMALAGLGLLWLSRVDAHTSSASLVARLALVGLGRAVFGAPNSSTLMGSVPAERRGVASGVWATGRVLGQSLGIALGGTLFTVLGGAAAGRLLASAGPQASSALEATFLRSFRTTLGVSAAIFFLAMLTSLSRGPDRPSGRDGQRTRSA